MKKITVKTKEELEKAKENGYDEIIVDGKLANDLKKSKKIALASGVVLVGITAAIGLMPVTGGLSVGVAAGVATLTGIEISAIIVAASLGIGLIIAIYKDYEEISYKDGELVIRKKAKD